MVSDAAAREDAETTKRNSKTAADAAVPCALARAPFLFTALDTAGGFLSAASGGAAATDVSAAAAAETASDDAASSQCFSDRDAERQAESQLRLRQGLCL